MGSDLNGSKDETPNFSIRWPRMSGYWWDWERGRDMSRSMREHGGRGSLLGTMLFLSQLRHERGASSRRGLDYA